MDTLLCGEEPEDKSDLLKMKGLPKDLDLTCVKSVHESVILCVWRGEAWEKYMCCLSTSSACIQKQTNAAKIHLVIESVPQYRRNCFFVLKEKVQGF